MELHLLIASALQKRIVSDVAYTPIKPIISPHDQLPDVFQIKTEPGEYTNKNNTRDPCVFDYLKLEIKQEDDNINIYDPLDLTGISNYNCHICIKEFNSFNCLQNHLETHNYEGIKKILNNPLLICDECNNVFTTKSSLKTHIRIHAGLQVYECHHCDKVFGQSSDFKKHSWVHNGIKPYACKQCSKSYFRSNDLKKHILRIHHIREIVCQLCEIHFKTLRKFNSHCRLKHTEIKSFSCNQCAKVFRYRSALTSHLLIHSEMKHFKCQICNRAFTQAGTLKKHLLTHTSLKDFGCSFCGKIFNSPTGLKAHKKFHSIIKPHKCNQCDVAFHYSGDLKKHLLIHAGIKPFTCNYCNKSFTRSNDLKRHYVRKHHTEKNCNK